MKTKPTILLLILVSIGCFFWGYKCSPTVSPLQAPYNSDKIDSLNLINSLLIEAKQAETIKVNHLDSLNKTLKQTKVIYTTRFIQAKAERVYINSDSLTCLAIFDELAQSCDSVNLVNDSLIVVLEQKDSTLQNIVEIQEKQLSIKDTTNQMLTESLVKSEQKVEKLQKKVKRNRVIAAISSGVAVVMALF